MKQQVELVHNTRSNNSRSNDARFMQKLCLSLHARNRLLGEYSLHRIEKLKDLLNNSNRAQPSWLLRELIHANYVQLISSRVCGFRRNHSEVFYDIGF